MFLFGEDVEHAVVQCESDVGQVEGTDGVALAEAFEEDVDAVAFLLELLLHIGGDVILSVVSSDEHEGAQGDALRTVLLELCPEVVERGVALDGGDKAACAALGGEHVAEHGVLCRGGIVAAVAHPDVGGAFSGRGGEGADHGRVILRHVKQRGADTDLLEVGGYGCHLATQGLHLYAFDDVGGLDDKVGEAVGFELLQHFKRSRCFDAAIMEPAAHDT